MNNVFLTGNLTAKPTETKFDNGNTVCRFTIAVNKQSKNKEKEVDFINIVAWNALAQNCIKYLDKGDRVAVQGSIQTGSYEKDGVKRHTFDVRASRIEFLRHAKSDATKDADNTTEDVAQELTDDDMPF